MPIRTIPELLATHWTLATTPSIWFDVASRRMTPQQAAKLLQDKESPELIARSQALFAPPPPEQDEQELQRLLKNPYFGSTRKRWYRFPWFCAMVALAGAMLLMWLPLPSYRPPGYVLTLTNVPAATRNVAPPKASVPVYPEDHIIKLVLHPARMVEQTIAVRMFAFDENGQAHRLAITPQINAYGVVHIEEPIRDMGLQAGTWQLAVVIGPPEHVPDEAAAVAPGFNGSHDVHYDVVHQPVRVVARGQRDDETTY